MIHSLPQNIRFYPDCRVDAPDAILDPERTELVVMDLDPVLPEAVLPLRIEEAELPLLTDPPRIFSNLVARSLIFFNMFICFDSLSNDFESSFWWLS